MKGLVCTVGFSNLRMMDEDGNVKNLGINDRKDTNTTEIAVDSDNDGTGSDSADYYEDHIPHSSYNGEPLKYTAYWTDDIWRVYTIDNPAVLTGAIVVLALDTDEIIICAVVDYEPIQKKYGAFIADYSDDSRLHYISTASGGGGNTTPTSSGTTLIKITVKKPTGSVKYNGFIYTPKDQGPTSYTHNGLKFLKMLGCQIIEPNNQRYYTVRLNGKSATIPVLTEGHYANFDCIQLNALRELGIGVEYSNKVLTLDLTDVYGEAGNPAITNDWLKLYSSPTVPSSGRSVAKHPDAFNYDWGMPEELNIGMSDNLLPVTLETQREKLLLKPLIIFM